MMTRSFDSLMESYERLLGRPNPADEHFYNGLFTRYRNPVLTREHIPPFWMYDADPDSNPFMMQRLGVSRWRRATGRRKDSGSGTIRCSCRIRKSRKPTSTTCG